MTIDPRGSLTPDAYTYGGLVAHGLQGVRLWSAEDTNWNKVDVVTPSGVGLWRGESLSGTSVLEYLGVTDPRTVTIWFEGEVWLEQTFTEMFRVRGDDVAFVEIALPGSASYTRLPQSTNPVTVATPQNGWYPIRIGFADGSGVRTFEFLHSDTGQTLIPWAHNRLRARTSELRGALRMVCNRQALGGGIGDAPPVSHVEQRNLLTEPNFSNNPPQGVDDADTNDWSARYVAQLYVEEPGDYSLSIDSDDGHRGRLGDIRGEDSWGRDQGDGSAFTTIPATLAAGWNDLMVDYNQVTGQSNLRIRLTGGGLDNAEIPADLLRPVESADDRVVFATDDTDRVIRNGGGPPATSELQLAAFAGETVTAIELTYQIVSNSWSDLRVELDRPGMGPVVIRPPGQSLPDGRQNVQLSIAMDSPLGVLLGGPVEGSWRLIVDDVVGDGGDSTLENFRLTLHTSGGPSKIALISSWTSPAFDAMTDVLAIDSITWDERVPVGSTIKVFARTCVQAGCADNQPWSAAAMKAMPVVVPRGRYLQLRVDMTSDGIHEPELHSLLVNYHRSE